MFVKEYNYLLKYRSSKDRLRLTAFIIKPPNQKTAGNQNPNPIGETSLKALFNRLTET